MELKQRLFVGLFAGAIGWGAGLVGATRAQAPPQSQPPATASEKPFLRPQVPTQPETQIVNFDPNATWP